MFPKVWLKKKIPEHQNYLGSLLEREIPRVYQVNLCKKVQEYAFQ